MKTGGVLCWTALALGNAWARNHDPCLWKRRAIGHRIASIFPLVRPSVLNNPVFSSKAIYQDVTLQTILFRRSFSLSASKKAVKHALISRFGTLGKVEREFLLISDNGLLFKSRHFTALVRSYRLKQKFITPHCPQQNGMVERVIRTLKEQCTHKLNGLDPQASLANSLDHINDHKINKLDLLLPWNRKLR